MYYYVYLLISKINNKHISYVGSTNNIEKRVNNHNLGKGAKFTRGKKWVLIYKKRYKSKSEALSNEYKLKKNYLRRKKIKQTYINSL